MSWVRTASLMVVLLVVSAAPVRAQISDEALEIHRSGLLFDGHNDLPWQIREQAGGSFDRLDIALPQPRLHTDLPRLKTSGLKAQFWSVYVPVEALAVNRSLSQTLEQIQIVRTMLQRYPDRFELALTADDVERIARSGKIASMIGVEGGHSIEDSLQVLQQLHKLGARYMTLTHTKTLNWADSSADKPRSGGLAPFGEDVVREMNRLGMLVDLSHVSIDTMHDALRVSRAPVIFSHSSARAICDHPRNVPDEVLKLLPANGGVVMINFYSGFIARTEELKRDRKARGTLATVADHIEHVIKVAGIDHVGIGSDFDGINSVPVGLEDVSKYPALTQELLNRGHKREAIHKVLGGNILRVLREAERVSKASIAR